ncbi:hypothetical protein GE09DRAFT_1140066 [Coniochaeta sp. 2T2.1]|nr:hypothetical protein GE09DRAFT_1140066 [Coniochaeta sp. 2T2.1]
MPSRKSDVSATTISNHHAPAADAADASEDSPMTSVPPPQSESSATPAAVGPTTAVSFAPPLPTEHGPPESPGVVARAESNAGTSEKGKERERDREGAVTIEDLNLPKSIITRLAKGVLPPNTQIQANAILALSKSATVFISHLSNAANEWTQSGGKKTIMPSDVFRALDDIEYGFMRERLEAEFAIQSTKRSAYRRKVSAAKRAARQANGDVSVADSSVLSRGDDDDGEDEDAMDETHVGDTTMGTTVSADDNGGARATKKARVDSSGGGAKMDVDNNGEVSDAETVPDEHVEDDDDEDEDEQEEEEEEEEEDDEEEGGQGEDDELEERGGREVEDEALDEDSE